MQRACQRSCAKLELCDDGTDVLDGERHCQDETVRSARYQEVRASCMDELSCNHLVAELDAAGESICKGGCVLEDCVGDALLALTPIEEQTTLCERTSSKLAACDAELDGSALMGARLELVPAISSACLDASGACADLPCSGIVHTAWRRRQTATIRSSASMTV